MAPNRAPGYLGWKLIGKAQTSSVEYEFPTEHVPAPDTLKSRFDTPSVRTFTDASCPAVEMGTNIVWDGEVLPMGVVPGKLYTPAKLAEVPKSVKVPANNPTVTIRAALNLANILKLRFAGVAESTNFDPTENLSISMPYKT
jgi:hypothetical protein